MEATLISGKTALRTWKGTGVWNRVPQGCLWINVLSSGLAPYSLAPYSPYNVLATDKAFRALVLRSILNVKTSHLGQCRYGVSALMMDRKVFGGILTHISTSNKASNLRICQHDYIDRLTSQEEFEF